MYRDVSLDKKVELLKDEVRQIKGETKLRWNLNVSDWRWPLAMLASVFVVCSHFSPSSHPYVAPSHTTSLQPKVANTVHPQCFENKARKFSYHSEVSLVTSPSSMAPIFRPRALPRYPVIDLGYFKKPW